MSTLVFLGALVVAFALGEIVVRVFDLPPHRLAALRHQNFMLSDDPILKYEYQPGFNGPFDEHSLSFAINADGFRDVRYPKAKPANVRRLILLGDSVTAGNGVADLESTFAKEVERILNAGSPEKPIEVLNMAVGGYNTLQEAELLRVRGMAYDPDAIAVCFCLNDFAWSSDGGVHARLRQQLEKRGSSDFARMPSASRLATWVLGHSRFAFSLYAMLTSLSDRREHQVQVDDRVVTGRDPVEMGLELLREIEVENSFPSALFIVPVLERPFSRYEHGAIHDRLRTTARSTMPDLQVVDLLDDLRQVRDDPSAWSFDGLHLTAAGHRQIARVMAPHLEQLLDRAAAPVSSRK